MKGKKKKGCLGKLIGIVLVLAVLFFVISIFMDDEEEYYDDSQMSYSGYSDDYDSDYDSEDSGYEAPAAELNTSDIGAQTATVMIYMIGSDLESDGGCATTDIQEMSYADLGSNVNLVLQTGGAKTWQNNMMKDGQVQRFAFENGSPELVQDLGRVSMVQGSTVTDFIKWAVKNYPADRYDLIFWNHGGGTIMGFGSDEMHPERNLTLSDLRTAIGNTGVHFDFIGFDACLMGTVETGVALADYADYLLGAEETEPGNGWYYSNWLTDLGSNPGISTEKLGKKIIDDFVKYNSYFDDTTLSLIRLDSIGEVYSALCSYFAQSKAELVDAGYARMSGARSRAKAFGDNEFEQIDIISYLNAVGNIAGSDAVRQAVSNAVVYTNGSVYDANGLAMYYPYSQLSEYSTVKNMLGRIGMNSRDYVNYFDTFVNNLAKGQSYSRGTSRSMSVAQQLTGYEETKPAEDFTAEEWFDDSAAQVEQAAVLSYDGSLTLTERDGSYVLELTDAQWDSVSYAEMSLYVDDGEGYMDFGTDTALTFTEDGALSGDFDFRWISLDGEQFVPFFTIEDVTDAEGKWHSVGYVPATLNGDRDIEIICYWDDENPDGIIKGYRFAAEEGSLPQRNLLQLKQGDTLEFYCDYYTYDGEYDASYYVGDPVTVGSEGLSLCYVEMADVETVVIAFHLQDLYRNDYWTDALELTLN